MSKTKKSRKQDESSEEDSEESSSSEPSTSESSSDESVDRKKRKHKKKSKKSRKHKSHKRKTSDSEEDDDDSSSTDDDEELVKRKKHKKHKKKHKRQKNEHESDLDVKIQESDKVLYISSGDEDKSKHIKRDKRLEELKKLRGHDGGKSSTSKWDSPADEKEADRKRFVHRTVCPPCGKTVAQSTQICDLKLFSFTDPVAIVVAAVATKRPPPLAPPETNTMIRAAKMIGMLGLVEAEEMNDDATNIRTTLSDILSITLLLCRDMTMCMRNADCPAMSIIGHQLMSIVMHGHRMMTDDQLVKHMRRPPGEAMNLSDHLCRHRQTTVTIIMVDSNIIAVAVLAVDRIISTIDRLMSVRIISVANETIMVNVMQADLIVVVVVVVVVVIMVTIITRQHMIMDGMAMIWHR